MAIRYGPNPLASLCLRVQGPEPGRGPYQVGFQYKVDVQPINPHKVTNRGPNAKSGLEQRRTIMPRGKSPAEHHLVMGASFKRVASVMRSGSIWLRIFPIGTHQHGKPLSHHDDPTREVYKQRLIVRGRGLAIFGREKREKREEP